MKGGLLPLALLIALLAYRPAFAEGAGYGDVYGSEFSWDITLANLHSSTLNLTRVDLDVSTSSFEEPLVWSSAREVDVNGNTVVFGTAAISGLGTTNLRMDGSWVPGEFFLLRAFPNDLDGIPENIPIRSMLGVGATFTFSDASTWSGAFADVPPPPGSPFPQGVYTLQPVAAPPPPPPPPPPQPVGIGYGDVVVSSEGAWSLRLVNEVGSTLSLTRIELDVGTSSFELPLQWISARELLADGQQSGTAAISGVGTETLVLEGEWAPGAFLSLAAFPRDPGGVLLESPVESMLGVEATFTFSDLSTWRGVFADVLPAAGSPFPEGFYTLQPLAAIPEPETWVLLLAGLGLLGFAARRKQGRTTF